MKKIKCPLCGNLMKEGPVVGKGPRGEKIIAYICPNKWGCGTVVHEKET